MSIGVGGFAYKALEDDYTVIYEYGGYNLNEARYRNSDQVCDGTIVISKECFVEPEIHEKIKKMPSGRKKLVVKRIPVWVDYDIMIHQNKIQVENCSHCWETTKDNLEIDYTVCHLLYKILIEHQIEGVIPERVSFHK